MGSYLHKICYRKKCKACEKLEISVIYDARVGKGKGVTRDINKTTIIPLAEYTKNRDTEAWFVYVG
jgi:hypothetical protein